MPAACGLSLGPAEDLHLELERRVEQVGDGGVVAVLEVDHDRAVREQAERERGDKDANSVAELAAGHDADKPAHQWFIAPGHRHLPIGERWASEESAVQVHIGCELLGAASGRGRALAAPVRWERR